MEKLNVGDTIYYLIGYKKLGGISKGIIKEENHHGFDFLVEESYDGAYHAFHASTSDLYKHKVDALIKLSNKLADEIKQLRLSIEDLSQYRYDVEKQISLEMEETICRS